MKNKILKSIISIGFATKGKSSGKIRTNIDTNKLRGLSSENHNELISQLSQILDQIKYRDIATLVSISPRQKQEIDVLLDGQKTLSAIKIYKEVTKVGLKEAKETIDKYISLR